MGVLDRVQRVVQAPVHGPECDRATAVRVAPVDTLADLSTTPSLSIVVPAYNEAHQIDTSSERLREWLEDRGGEWQILVVDNASTDDTAALARAAGSRCW